MGIADELTKLEQLHKSGALNEPEYQAAKARLLLDGAPQSGTAPFPAKDLASEARTWAILIHASQFLGHVMFLAGFVVPIVLWQIKKNELPTIDEHGKRVANWIISEFIYAIICVLLIFVAVGIPLLIVLGIISIVFPIIGAVKAGNGEVWKYPLSITFFPPAITDTYPPDRQTFGP